MAGKGTYTAMLKEIVGEDLIEHISVGDVVRKAHTEYSEKGKDSAVYNYVKENYRGFIDLEKAFEMLVNRDTQTVSIPTEFVLSLVKREIDTMPYKTLFIDGFPRKIDQISYSLYFRELINHRNDQDLFILINLPLEIINQRIVSRVICPKCQTSKNIRLNPSTKYGLDKETGEVYLICDNPNCEETRMVKKEGDELGIENIKERIINDLNLMEQARNMYGIKRVELFNALEKDKALDYVNDYEITKEYSFKAKEDGTIERIEHPFYIKEDESEFVSLLPATLVVQLIKQLVYNLGL
jgi:adenylate kinase family enzyme